MSGTASTPAGGPLTDAERVDVRRFCGYSVYGPGASGFVGYRFFQAYGMLEYRLTNLAPAELSVLRTYLAQLQSMEAGIVGAAGNLQFDQAAVVKRNRTEILDRTRLFEDWRQRLCGFMGVPPGPQMQSAQAGRVIM